MPNALAKKAGPFPVWAWGIAGLVAVGAFFFLRRRPAPGTATDVINSPSQAPANSGTPGDNSAPADSLDSSVLAALGFSLETLGTMGNALADVAIGAQNQLGFIAATTVESSFAFSQSALASSFAFGQTALEGAFSLAGQAVAASAVPIYINQGDSGSSDGGNNAARVSSPRINPSSAIVPSSLPHITQTPSQVSHREFAARSAAASATGHWTAGL